VNDCLLCIRTSCFVTDGCSGAVAGKIGIDARDAIAKTIMPCVPYLVIAGVVALEIIDQDEVRDGESPDPSFADGSTTPSGGV